MLPRMQPPAAKWRPSTPLTSSVMKRYLNYLQSVLLSSFIKRVFSHHLNACHRHTPACVLFSTLHL